MASDRDNRLGKYVLRSKLGRGGMGIVYLATDTRLKRDVALKVLSKELASNAEAVQRFLQEARAAAQLNHPNVVMVHDVDQERGHCFLVMELVTGGTAQERLAESPLDWVEATRTIADACRGLAAAHQAGLIHRDIKPANLLRTADGVIKLADFGLAKVTDASNSTGPQTKSGTILGTPQFMSPEQCSGEPIDARSDIYSLGATYFALLTGEPPYVEAQPLQIMFAHCSKPVPDPRTRRPEIPAACAHVVMKALGKRRAERFTSADEFLAALNALLIDANTVNRSQTNAGYSPTTTSDDLPETRIQQPAMLASGVSEPSHDNNATWGSRLRTEPASALTTLMRLKPFAKPRAIGIAIAILPIAFLGFAWLMGWIGHEPSASNAANHPSSASSPNNSGSTSKTPSEPITLQLVAEFPPIQSAVMSVAFAHDGQAAYSASADGGVKQWTLTPPTVAHEFKEATQTIRAIAANDRWVAAGGDARCVWLWDQATRELHTKLKEPRAEVSALAFSSNGSRLAVGSYGDLCLYELDSSGPKFLKRLGDSSSSPVGCYMVKSIAFSTDSRWLAATTWTNKAVAVWDATTGELHQHHRDQPMQPITIRFVPNQDQLIFGTQQDGLRFWDLSKSSITPIAASAGNEVRTVAVTKDGNWAITVGPWGGLIRIHDVHSKLISRSVKQSQETAAMGIVISPTGQQLLTYGGDEGKPRGYINLWNIVAETSE